MRNKSHSTTRPRDPPAVAPKAFSYRLAPADREWVSLEQLGADFALRRCQVVAVLRHIGAVAPHGMHPAPAVQASAQVRARNRGWLWHRQAWARLLGAMGAVPVDAAESLAFAWGLDLARAVRRANAKARRLGADEGKMPATLEVMPAMLELAAHVKRQAPADQPRQLEAFVVELLGFGFKLNTVCGIIQHAAIQAPASLGEGTVEQVVARARARMLQAALPSPSPRSAPRRM